MAETDGILFTSFGAIDTGEVLFIVVWIVVFGGLGYYISTQKGREPAEGMILGAIFGPLGAIIAALLPDKK